MSLLRYVYLASSLSDLSVGMPKGQPLTLSNVVLFVWCFSTVSGILSLDVLPHLKTTLCRHLTFSGLTINKITQHKQRNQQDGEHNPSELSWTQLSKG